MYTSRVFSSECGRQLPIVDLGPAEMDYLHLHQPTTPCRLPYQISAHVGPSEIARASQIAWAGLCDASADLNGAYFYREDIRYPARSAFRGRWTAWLDLVAGYQPCPVICGIFGATRSDRLLHVGGWASDMAWLYGWLTWIIKRAQANNMPLIPRRRLTPSSGVPTTGSQVCALVVSIASRPHQPSAFTRPSPVVVHRPSRGLIIHCSLSHAKKFYMMYSNARIFFCVWFAWDGRVVDLVEFEMAGSPDNSNGVREVVRNRAYAVRVTRFSTGWVMISNGKSYCRAVFESYRRHWVSRLTSTKRFQAG